jgi:hypothetical protein
MMNVGSRAPACPPPLILRYARGDPLPYKTSVPDQGMDWIGFRIPGTFPKGKEIAFLTGGSQQGWRQGSSCVGRNLARGDVGDDGWDS